MSRSLLEHAPEVEAYLSEMTRQMGAMPAEQRAEIHEELRQHLDALIAAHEEVGTPPAEAVGAALAQFGAPRKLGRKLRREWLLAHRDPQAAALCEGIVGFTLVGAAWLPLFRSGHAAAGVAALCSLSFAAGWALERRRPGYALCGLLLAAVAFFAAFPCLLTIPEGRLVFAHLAPVIVFQALFSGVGAYLAGAGRRRRLWYRYPIENLRLRLRAR